MNRCWLPQAFSASVKMILWFLSFILFICCIMLIDLHMLNLLGCLEWNQVDHGIVLMCYWVQLASIYWKFCNCSSRKLVYNSFLLCSCFSIKAILVVEWIW
jgi:hypothetical protein